MAAASAFGGGFAACFFEPIGEHGFGVIGGPLVGQHLVETRVVANLSEFFQCFGQLNVRSNEQLDDLVAQAQ